MNERLRNDLETRTYKVGTVLHWSSNDAVVPPHVFDDAGVDVPPGQREAREREVERSIRAYREARRNRTAEQRAEEAFEMRAAFGPGETVVDLLTGEEFRT